MKPAFSYIICELYYIIPGIPPPIGGAAGIGFSSALSVMIHSVVNTIEAIEAAFSNAILDTLAGSITPAAFKSSYCSVLALKPKLESPSNTLFTTIEPSKPAFSTI